MSTVARVAQKIWTTRWLWSCMVKSTQRQVELFQNDFAFLFHFLSLLGLSVSHSQSQSVYSCAWVWSGWYMCITEPVCSLPWWDGASLCVRDKWKAFITVKITVRVQLQLLKKFCLSQLLWIAEPCAAKFGMMTPIPTHPTPDPFCFCFSFFL